MILLRSGCLQNPDNNRSTEVWNKDPQGGLYEKMIETSTALTHVMAALKFLHSLPEQKHYQGRYKYETISTNDP